jgi:hypothetical protein
MRSKSHKKKIQDRDYEFIVDTGTDICLIQPYVGEEPPQEITETVRVISGKELEVIGSRRIEFAIGNKWYSHEFVVAPSPSKRTGSSG